MRILLLLLLHPRYINIVILNIFSLLLLLFVLLVVVFHHHVLLLKNNNDDTTTTRLLLLDEIDDDFISSGNATDNNNTNHILGNDNEWMYQYEPNYIQLPSEVYIENAHGIAIDQHSIIITYQDQYNTSQCLLKWKLSSINEALGVLIGPGESLCNGVPHGLQMIYEDNIPYLYHANNEQLLHKTTVNGTIIWTVNGYPIIDNDNNNSNGTSFRPTWFAAAPNSPYVYLVDGYGSNKVYVYYRNNGTYTGYSFGGIGSEHGMFQTNHAITYNIHSTDNNQQMIICDRENHRLEFYNINNNNPSIFIYNYTISYAPLLLRPCNIRFHSYIKNIAIISFLDGYVAIVNEHFEIITVLDIVSFGNDLGYMHPHDIHFISNGGTLYDFILVTWNPGRIGYFRHINISSSTTTSSASWDTNIITSLD